MQTLHRCKGLGRGLPRYMSEVFQVDNLARMKKVVTTQSKVMDQKSHCVSVPLFRQYFHSERSISLILAMYGPAKLSRKTMMLID